MQMQLSLAGLELIKASEGLRLNAYQDSAGIWTIGYGHTGADVHKGLVITEPAAAALLRGDVQEAVDFVNAHVLVALTQGQFDALVSFAYNLGNGRLQRSKLLQLVNASRFKEAAEQFLLFINSAGKELPGLKTRRLAERKLFLS